MRGTSAAGLVLALALSGCTAEPSEEAPVAPTPSSVAERTTLATYPTRGVAVARSPFCDRVSPTGIEHALGEAATEHEEHVNGDPIRLADGTRSIAHEYGCSWTGSDGAVARAWVFAPPVTAGQARAYAAEAQEGRCARTGTGEYGAPSVGVRCRTDAGPESSWRGLFGDAWLVCSVTADGPPAQVDERASEWCVAVLEAARA